MIKVIGVQFRSGVRIYDFKQSSEDMRIGGLVLVETTQGEEIGTIKYINKELKSASGNPVKDVMRVLSDKDIARLKRLKLENPEYETIFKKKVSDYGLGMKFVDFEVSLDGEKVTFYFTAEKRVDFRDLVRELSRRIRKTVLLRQMGQRDEARGLDGFGPCGEEICCKRFLKEMENISMDMVREQFSGNKSASKVSGVCGKLMCCMAYEKDNKNKKKVEG